MLALRNHVKILENRQRDDGKTYRMGLNRSERNRICDGFDDILVFFVFIASLDINHAILHLFFHFSLPFFACRLYNQSNTTIR